MKVCSVCQRCYEDSVLSCSESNHDILTEGRVGSCEIIPNYRLESRQEATPFTETYLAAHTILNKPYLFKTFAPAPPDENAKKQFLSEAQALATMIHPNVARVFESGTLADGALYVVTEFFDGAETLRDALANSLNEVAAVTAARQAAEGLEAIHAAGALHRNLRPENILFIKDAENRLTVKLQNIDFGGVHQRQVNAHGDLYLSDLRYFSPEQCEAKNADAQTDVYALGIVLYEMLAGRVPFDAPYADALAAQQIKEAPPEVKVKSFDIRMLLTHTLSDALQKQARTRLKTANAFARRLRHIEQLATHSSTPPPAVAYPATMIKQVALPTPPVKVAKPFETNKAVEIPKPAEVSKAVETAPPDAELQPLAEEPAKVETPLSVEPLTFAESAVLIEETEAFETTTAVAETPIIIENSFAAESRAAIETQAEVEESPATQGRSSSEKVATSVAPVIDYTTTKLPPIESILENSLLETKFEIAAPAEEKAKNQEIHTTAEPVLIDWEQPDDVPTTTQTLNISRKAKADAEFTAKPETFNAEDETAEDAVLEADEVEYVSESYQTRRDYAQVKPVFSYEETSRGGAAWNLPQKRTIVAGAAVLGLLIVAVGGTVLNRWMQSPAFDNQTSAQTAPSERTLPEAAEKEKNPAAETRDLAVSDSSPVIETAETTVALPAYAPRETDEKALMPVLPSRVAGARKPASKKSVETRPNPAPMKIEEEAVFDKKGNVKPAADKKSANKNQAASSSKSDEFTRPRIVKTPKF